LRNRVEEMRKHTTRASRSCSKPSKRLLEVEAQPKKRIGFTGEKAVSMHRLFADILAGGPGAPPGFDFDRYNLTQTRKLDGLSLDELIERFTAVRRETIRIVREMKEEDLDSGVKGSGSRSSIFKWWRGTRGLPSRNRSRQRFFVSATLACPPRRLIYLRNTQRTERRRGLR
jgi:hypothetical protein